MQKASLLCGTVRSIRREGTGSRDLNNVVVNVGVDAVALPTVGFTARYNCGRDVGNNSIEQLTCSQVG